MSGVISPTTIRALLSGRNVAAYCAAQIRRGDGRDGVRGAGHRRAVAVRLPVQDSCERLGGDGGRIVASLQQSRQPLLAHPLELFLRERRPQRDVGHDRQRIGQPRDRHMQPDRR